MQRSTLTALLVSTIVGASVVGYGMFSHAEDKNTATAKTEAAAKTDKKSEAKGEDYAVIKYKGGQVMRSELDMLWQNMFPNADAPDYDSFDDNVKAEILKNIARERLVLNKAQAKNVEHTNEFKERMDVMKRQMMIQVYLKSMLDEIVPEKDVKKEYEVIKEKFAGKKEVKASHILVDSEEEAKAIHKEIKDGADFAKLAEEKSIDKASGAKGGDLGFFTKDRMVPEFADAAFAADKGEVTEPVKSDFGWHIIKVEDKRNVEPPKYDEVKERIQESLANAAIERYVNNMIAEANITYYDKDGNKLTPPAAADAEAK
ncbi:MAG: peptidylprolyl isomerase [Alphaproteobacteria bacterium]|nr:peptidylprolyl isomerase [Alphaproteobacteria bacterium]